MQYADRVLIALCITIKAELAAFYGCSGADPDGDGAHAEPFWSRHMERANKAAEKAAAIKATTWAGLAAKAAAMTAILDDDCRGGLSMEERSEAFYRSFADDVYRLAMVETDREQRAATANLSAAVAS